VQHIPLATWWTNDSEKPSLHKYLDAGEIQHTVLKSLAQVPEKEGKSPGTKQEKGYETQGRQMYRSDCVQQALPPSLISMECSTILLSSDVWWNSPGKPCVFEVVDF
jgi:hypothetical protein